eukprot:3463526-Amphidinium_carterae.1
MGFACLVCSGSCGTTQRGVELESGIACQARLGFDGCCLRLHQRSRGCAGPETASLGTMHPRLNTPTNQNTGVNVDQRNLWEPDFGCSLSLALSFWLSHVVENRHGVADPHLHATMHTEYIQKLTVQRAQSKRLQNLLGRAEREHSLWGPIKCSCLNRLATVPKQGIQIATMTGAAKGP